MLLGRMSKSIVCFRVVSRCHIAGVGPGRCGSYAWGADNRRNKM